MHYGPIKLSVPTFRRIDDDHDRSYTVFSISVTHAGRRFTIEKRYSEFEELHKQLKTKYPSLLFPGKSVLKWSPKVLEYRRQAFENYLQAITEDHRIPQCVRLFLELGEDDKCSSTESLNKLDHSSAVTQPLVAFAEDAFLHESSQDGLPDVITSGTLQGLYGSHSSVNDMQG